ncbi:MAG: SPOR domain-containing protein, partial [Alphaproteobacteria bacterium]|nr:SPOR domain-containing protein [Alphaproteobacteria bacterium]
MPLRDQDNFDSDLLDIVPERMGGDSERGGERKSGGKGRLLLTLGLALSAAVATVAAGWHIFLRDQPAMPPGGVPTITADQAPLKARPDDRGGMDVPNQDKLVYNRMGGNANEPQVERLLPPPEQPKQPPAPPPLPPTQA